MKKTLTIIGLAAATLAGAQGADEYWRTDGTAGGTWTSTYWNIGSANATGGTGWTASNNAVFTANSTLTFATATVGNVTVADGVTVTVTKAGTLSLGGVRTFDIGAGSALTWTTQPVTANSAAGITKNGAGTLNLGALTFSTNMNGGFTLNNGTLIVSGLKALGNGALALNGGTLSSSGGNAFTTTSIAIGGDFTLAGTGNDNYDAATTIALGSSTRTITNTTTAGSRQFRGLISGGAGAGLTFAGAGTGLTYIGNTGNTFTGPVAINGGEVVFNGDGALGATTSVTIDGGRLTMGTMDTAGVVTALTSATISSSKNIFLGSTASTAINISGAAGATTYNGVIADKSGSTGAWAKQGTGTLSLGGANTYTGTTTVTSGTLLIEGAQSGSGTVTVQSGGTLGGDGSIAGSLSLASGAKFVFSLTKTFTVNGASVSFGGFGISNLVGLDFSAANGTYALINGSAAFDFTNVSNVGPGSAFDLGSGKSAYFQTGGLNVVVVPEPKTCTLFGVGFAFMLWNLRRRRVFEG